MKHKKIFTFEDILKEREQFRQMELCGIKKFVAFTNGCFDLFHTGHAYLLNTIKESSSNNSRLIVGVNSDKSVKSLKGDSRPIIPAAQRAYTVACHEAVDYVFIYDTKTVSKQLKELEPDFWFKGGDYKLEDLNKRELKAKGNSAVRIVPLLEGASTSNIIKKIK
jgi:rfaE bifunctional protein nucleotidyltransferase chain/domain|tara:strand:- start:23 stop:517 length:495 start_codon:yes stop_codon:yes gene_type:complete